MDRLKYVMVKYRYVLLVVLAGLVLMLLPDHTEAPEPIADVVTEESLQAQLEEILSRVEGAGKVTVLLTESRGGEIFYQTEGDDQRTVLVTGSDRSESGLVRTTQSPVYQGAVVVCQGADSPAVRLAVVEAVSNATGLGTDRITVLKME